MEKENIIERFDEFNPITFNRVIKEMLPQFEKEYSKYIYNYLINRICYNLDARMFNKNIQTYFICG